MALLLPFFLLFLFVSPLMQAMVMQISKQYTQYGAALLFFAFGLKMLYEVATAVEKVIFFASLRC